MEGYWTPSIKIGISNLSCLNPCFRGRVLDGPTKVENLLTQVSILVFVEGYWTAIIDEFQSKWKGLNPCFRGRVLDKIIRIFDPYTLSLNPCFRGRVLDFYKWN